MRILAGTDLKTVALPTIPEGYRWVIDNRKFRESSWTETYKVMALCISLEREATNWRGKVKWVVEYCHKIEPKHTSGDFVGGFGSFETVVECAERLAREIKQQHIKRLQKALEQESIIGVYEQGAKQALS